MKAFWYSETSLNRTLRKLVLPEYRPIFWVPAGQFFAKEVSQNRPPLLTGPIFRSHADRFREVSLNNDILTFIYSSLETIKWVGYAFFLQC
jgi:hypothetical protein